MIDDFLQIQNNYTFTITLIGLAESAFPISGLRHAHHETLTLNGGPAHAEPDQLSCLTGISPFPVRYA